MQNRLYKLKYRKNDSGGGDSGDVGDGGPGTPGSGLLTPQQEMNEITRRLDKLRGNKNELSPYNTPAQNSAIVAQQNNQKFLDRQMNQREREIKKTRCLKHQIIIGLMLHKIGLVHLIYLLLDCHVHLLLLFLIMNVIFHLFQSLFHNRLNQEKLVFYFLMEVSFP